MAAVVAHFAVDATMVLPDGSVLKGRDASRRHYEDTVRRFPSLTVRPGAVIGVGDEAAIEWQALVVDSHGLERELRGVNLVRTSGGLFTELRTFFGPSAHQSAPHEHSSHPTRS
ncbi:MAG: nuclear transport factor 2 family protein [Actinomycetota bacterium]|nr:nuclear transport factor 2 family protein [Actinomycetota bacterium]